MNLKVKKIALSQKMELPQQILNLLPYPCRYYFQKEIRKASPKAVRQDVQQFHLEPNVYFETYWKKYGIGKGPAVIFYAFEEEVLKFDFFGKGKGHFHTQLLKPAPTEREVLFFAEETVKAQIERAIFEFEHNLYWYLQRHPLKSIRQLQFDNDSLIKTLKLVKAKLISYDQ